mmetsp:Transcript_17840/g.36017  ORF Transcript_17840/g.36017 Transcript_17840/m.36017 type:complete len:557 (+) Transcript_17840:383-2053(+)
MNADENERKWKESLTSDDTIGSYKVDSLIAFGGFGCVRLCTRTGKKKERVAVKTFILERMRSNDDENMKRELSVLMRSNHPNIIQLYEVIEDAQCVHLVLEFASGGDLFTQIKRHGAVGEPEASRIFSQLINALDYLHFTLKVCHRDIKLENLLFTDLRTRNIKIIDFNLSSAFKGTECMVDTARGTPQYAAPEVVRCMQARGVTQQNLVVETLRENSEQPMPPKKAAQPHNHTQKKMTTTTSTSTSTTTATATVSSMTTTKTQKMSIEVEVEGKDRGAIGQEGSLWYDACKSDLWACGVVLFVLVYGYLPFFEQSLNELFTQVLRGLPTSLPPPASKAVRSLILRLLDNNTKTRISIPEIRKHPWIASRFNPPTPVQLPHSLSPKINNNHESSTSTSSGQTGRRGPDGKAVTNMLKVDVLSLGKPATGLPPSSPEAKTQPDGSWYHKLHQGVLSTHHEDEEDGVRTSENTPNPSRSRMPDWSIPRHVTGTSGDSWSQARQNAPGREAKNAPSQAAKDESASPVRITQEMLMQHIDEEDEEEAVRSTSSCSEPLQY